MKQQLLMYDAAAVSREQGLDLTDLLQILKGSDLFEEIVSKAKVMTYESES